MKPIPTNQTGIADRARRWAWVPIPGGGVLRYGFAGAAVAAGFGLRLALERWVGPGLATYITFYPAVMVAALLGGFGPGLLATVVTTLVSAYWILQPVGNFTITSPVDRLGVVLFTLMGLFISTVAELYSRNRRKAAAQERELALREGREALQRQAELIDPVRAEIIAQEMLRVVRRRSAPAPVAPLGNWVRRLPTAMGVAAAVIGAMALLGWALGAEWLTRVAPGLPTMKFNTGLCFLLVGLALALRDRRGFRLAFAVTACVAAGLTLAEYATGWDFGIDQLVFGESPDANTIYPGRMVPATALCFLMSGAALLSLRSRRSRWTQQSLAVLTGLLGMMGLLGYAYGVEAMHRFAGHSSMALHTAAAFTLLAIGLVFARSDGLAPLLMADSPGSHAARRFLPVVIPVTLFVGWLHRLLERNQVVSPAVGDCLVVIVLVFVFVLLVWWTARVLNRNDAIRREVEGQLQDQAELMNLAKEGLIVRELDGAIRSWNRGAEALYGWSAAETLGQNIHTLLRTEGVDLTGMAEQLERTDHWEGELLQTTRDGRRLTIESHKTLTRTSDGRLLILENNRDITARKRAEEDLRQSERLYRGIGESIDYGIWICDPQGRNTYASESFLKLVGITQEECSGLQWGDVLHPDDVEATIAAWLQCVQTGGPWYREHRFRGADGQWHPILACGVAIRNEQGEVTAWAGINLDISRIKQTEEALRVSLHEKEVLLKEVHHRVKNNLQVISSLVSLQADALTDPNLREVFEEVRDRVRAMALVHETLYQSDNLAQVDLAEYARNLLHQLWRGHSGVSVVNLNLSLEPVALSVETAVPCGLILNELASNALRHAFKGRASGEVAVSLKRVPATGRALLTVSDTGVGLPEGFDWRNAKSLGLRLVHMLAKQIGGIVETRSAELGGVEFRVEFPVRAGEGH